MYEIFETTLDSIGPLQVSASPYDTAWLARMEGEIGQSARQWLLDNQLPDGAWGAAVPVYYHDRVICTLAAIATLLQTGFEPTSPPIQRARASLDRSLKGLPLDASGATVGFELIMPSLCKEASVLGVSIDGPSLERLVWARTAKLASLPSRRIDRRFTPSFSAEAVGRDNLHLLDVDNLQAPNGSVAFSPSATAFFYNYARQDPDAWAYLTRVIGDDGAVPYVGPIEVFDRGWALWNLSLLAPEARSDGLGARVAAHAAVLQKEWQPGRGIASAIGLPLLDGDDSAIVFAALHRLGYELDIEGVLAFQSAFNFRCYPLESDPSTSTNVHVLDALRAAGLSACDRAVQMVVTFLRRTQVDCMYWLDKWHASPYYPTAHAVIALAGLDDGLAQSAVDWIRATQCPDGSWGWYMPTAEETAYALQALVTWHRLGHAVDRESLRRGRQWLESHPETGTYPPLWIGKCLYAPVVPIRAAIASALLLSKEV